ncbi:hypothetical protein V6N11_001452 [Hibiscus sabdariffa]|uniref:Retrotransposon gag domain-containing protein n=1 Tax=Hibiscus sabdariffa TaxID=183260 RepID=A0ABR2RZS6_9ROSI
MDEVAPIIANLSAGAKITTTKIWQELRSSVGKVEWQRLVWRGRPPLQDMAGRARFIGFQQGEHHYIEIEHTRILRFPSPMKPSDLREQFYKRCEFHKEYGHYIDYCAQLKNVIDFIVGRCQFERFIVSSRRNHHNQGMNNQGALGSGSQAKDRNKQVSRGTISTNEQWSQSNYKMKAYMHNVISVFLGFSKKLRYKESRNVSFLENEEDKVLVIRGMILLL